MGVVVLTARELAVTLWTKVPGSGCSDQREECSAKAVTDPTQEVAIIVPLKTREQVDMAAALDHDPLDDLPDRAPTGPHQLRHGAL
jgi:hypothetical protein